MDETDKQKNAPQSLASNPKHPSHSLPHAQPHRLRQALLIAGGLIGAGLLLAFTYIGLLIPDAPDTSDLQHARTEQPSVLLSADGKTLGSFRQAQQQWVDLKHVSPHVINALIATEDHRFYEHKGIDIGRTLAAAFHTANGDTQGGSTITQQLARNMFPNEIGRSRTVNRKLKEWITAIRIERSYSKQQILETYLNTVPFLYNVTGIEMAARTYYGKPAARLGPLESATLIGMLKGTHYYNPVVNPERALKRRNVVLAQMVKYGQLPESQYRALRDQPLQLHFARQIEHHDDSAPHFAAYVRKWLTEWADRHDIDLYADGLIVHTTIDLTLQQAATRAVERQASILQDIADVEWSRKDGRLLSTRSDAYTHMHGRIEPFRHFWDSNQALLEAFVRETPEFRKALGAGASESAALAQLKANASFMTRLRAAKTRLEAGFMAMDPATGEIKAWVGSRDFERDQFDHVAQAERQPGSTFKPIVYGAALEQGFSPDHTYQDLPVEIRAPDGSVWRPTDMSGASGMPMTLREGLIFSKNTITAQVMQDVGLPSIVGLAQAAGINRSKLNPVPSLALGTSPVTLLEMVSAYATIAAGGEYRQPIFIKRITDRNGKMIAEFGAERRRAMSTDTAIELIDMMRGVVNRGTGQVVKTRFGVIGDIAGKTGTTQNNTDGWFILMHPSLVAGAWIGFNDARVTMRSNYWGQGGHNAIRVVGDFFRDTLKAKLIDARTKFARPKRMPLVVHAGRPPDDWNSNFVDADGAESLPPGTGVIVRRDGRRTGIGDVPGSGRARKTDDELARMLVEMGRDPVTGERVLSSGSNGNEAVELKTSRGPRRNRGAAQFGAGLGPNDLSMPPR